MTIQLTRNPNQKLIELGGGNNPVVHPQCLGGPDVNCDIALFQNAEGKQCVDFACDFNELPLPISSDEFDGIVSIFALEHISWRKTQDFLKEMFRVIKPGAKAVVVVPNTEAQMKYIQEHPEGWENRDFFTCASVTLYGDQNYNSNHHCAFFSPAIAHQLFSAAGFEGIVTQPYGAIETDMLIEAVKPMKVDLAEKEREEEIRSIKQKMKEAEDRIRSERPNEELDIRWEGGADGLGGVPVIKRRDLILKATQEVDVKDTTHVPLASVGLSAEIKPQKEKIFEGWDYPVHEIVFRKILERKPQSVLELGAGRGYVGKRIEDAGIRYIGLDKSKQLYMTRVASTIYQHDITLPWMNDKIAISSEDFCFSMSVLDQFNPDQVSFIVKEMERTCKRGLHGIDMNKIQLPLQWWKAQLPKTHEVFSTDELQQGNYPEEYLEGDGKTKLNLGSFTTMYHNGWINLDALDVSPFANAYQFKFKQCDVRQGLPFGTGTVDCIYSSHMIEHLDYGAGVSLLRECRRVIRPDGAMRIVCPDARLLMDMYVKEPARLNDYDCMNDGARKAKTSAEKLWAMLHEGHSCCYDEPTLSKALEESGWIPHQASFRNTINHERSKQILRETLDMVPCVSLYMDCLPKLA